MIEHRTGSDHFSMLRGMALLGGSSMVTAVVGLIRGKALAHLVGPEGMGIYGYAVGVLELIGIITSFGIGTAGIRAIAMAASADQSVTPSSSLVRQTLFMTTWITGGLGICITIMIWPILPYTVKNSLGFTPWILLSTALLFRARNTALTCVIQGQRRLGDLARVQIIGAVVGLLLSLPLIAISPNKAVVAVITSGMVCSWVVASYFARQGAFVQEPASRTERIQIAKDLLFTGTPIMLASLAGTISPMIERVILERRTGLDGLGLYFAAGSMSTVLVNFILVSLTTDLYPRLASLLHEPRQFTEYLARHLRMAYLLAFPGLAGLAFLAPELLKLLYSERFSSAAPILSTLAVAAFGRIASTSVRCALLARGHSVFSLINEIGGLSLGLVLMIPFTAWRGSIGAAQALLIASVIQSIASYWILIYHMRIRELRRQCIEHFALVGYMTGSVLMLSQTSPGPLIRVVAFAAFISPIIWSLAKGHTNKASYT